MAITDVQNARSEYDTVLASEVSARNDLDNALETLRQITGIDYPQLATLNIASFKTQRPDAITSLLKEAENCNLSLLSARLSQDLAREQIRYYQAGHLPTLDLNVSSTVSNTDYNGFRANTTSYADRHIGENAIGLGLNVPIYSGGSVTSQVKQAQYNFVSASEQLESVHRSMVSTLRSSFNNISASISSVAAYEQGGSVGAKLSGRVGSRLSGGHPHYRRRAGRHHHII